jgi:predicted phosphoribosyltransferase
VNVFRDRVSGQANFWLKKFQEYACKENTIVLTVPAGGVPLGYKCVYVIRNFMGGRDKYLFY